MACGTAIAHYLATAEEPGGIVIAEQLAVGGGGYARHHRNGGQQAESAGQKAQRQNSQLQHQQALNRPPVLLNFGEARLQGLDGAEAPKYRQVAQKGLVHLDIQAQDTVQ